MKFWNELTTLISTIRIADIVDILAITFIIYKLIMLVKETRAEQLLKGLFIILIFSKISSAFNLYTLNWVINNLFTVGIVLVIVVFQPELRRAFEKLGRSNKWLTNIVKIKGEQSTYKADEITNAVASLARQKIGALIVVERNVGLSDIAETGTYINGLVSSELLINLFIPNTPLHDGAVIIKDDKIVAAGCFLPLTSNMNLSKELGTRHRAAIGITEKSDAFVIIVSEETGIISTAQNSNISRHVDTETLRGMLYKVFLGEEDRKDEIDGGLNEAIKK